MASHPSPLNEELKGSSRKWFYFSPFQDHCLPGSRGARIPSAPSPWQEIYPERMLITLFSTYFLYILLIPLFLILPPICFGSLASQMGTNKGGHSPWAGPSILTPNDFWRRGGVVAIPLVRLGPWPGLICMAGCCPGLAGFPEGLGGQSAVIGSHLTDLGHHPLGSGERPERAGRPALHAADLRFKSQHCRGSSEPH